ncbi:MAG TPA: hypothetical protein VFT59_04660 [Candidatus Saccharimonadales bacterium]|nr:hypothetical protein [Candidatus Saccharimonadales bacterium]
MSQLSVAAENLLFSSAKTISMLMPGHALGNGTLKPLLQRYDKESIVASLAKQVEQLSQGTFTVRQAGRELLHSYVQGTSIGVVVCFYDTPAGEVHDPHLVQLAWFLTDAGLLPARFDAMPEEAWEYIVQSDNL